MNLLRPRFGEQFISCLLLVDWPPRSYDITLLDFYLRGCVKSKFVVYKPASIEVWNANISKVIRELRNEDLQRVIQNLCLRMAELRRLQPTFEIINVMNASTQKKGCQLIRIFVVLFQCKIRYL